MGVGGSVGITRFALGHPRRHVTGLEEAARPRALDAVRIGQQVRERLTEWKEMCGRQVSWTRQIMTKLPMGR